MENMNSLKCSPRKLPEENELLEPQLANNDGTMNQYIFQLQKENLELKKSNETLIQKINLYENEFIVKDKEIKQLKEFQFSLNKIKEENNHHLSYIKTLLNENELLQKEYSSIKNDYDDLLIKFENSNRMKKALQAAHLNKKTSSSQNLIQNAANSPKTMDINLKDYPNSPKNIKNFDQLSW